MIQIKTSRNFLRSTCLKLIFAKVNVTKVAEQIRFDVRVLHNRESWWYRKLQQTKTLVTAEWLHSHALCSNSISPLRSPELRLNRVSQIQKCRINTYWQYPPGMLVKLTTIFFTKNGRIMVNFDNFREENQKPKICLSFLRFIRNDGIWNNAVVQMIMNKFIYL